jgi:hypothetical protein
MAHLSCLLYVLAEHAVVLPLDMLEHQATHGVTVPHELWIRLTGGGISFGEFNLERSRDGVI